MCSTQGFALLQAIVLCLLVLPIYSHNITLERHSKPAKEDTGKYKFLYFAFEKLGSHGLQISQSGKVLARQGHNVTFLLPSDGPRMPKTSDADLFSFAVFKSEYTAEAKREVFRELSRLSLSGELGTFSGIARLIYKTFITGKPPFIHMLIDECDSLLADNETLASLRQEHFDMMVADDMSLCNAILAEVLEIPFIQCANWGPMPERHGSYFQIPTDPSYIPGRMTRLTDRMSFSGRFQNVIAHLTGDFVHLDFSERYQKLKVKYDINPETHVLQSQKKALLWFFNMNYPLEFPRPMHPNTIYSAAMFKAPDKNVPVAEDVAEFMDSAPNGAVIFSFGTHVEAMSVQQAQMFADGFAQLSQRVLWQSSADLSKVKMGENTKLVRWIPLAQLMMHDKTKVLVTHGGINCLQEAIWAGLPIVGIPLLFDQFDNVDRAVARGMGVSLDEVTKVTSDILRDAITTVVNDPRYQENTRRLSAIMKDLTGGVPQHEIAAHWILHVTKFGGEHLRPAVLDLNYIQRNLLDVYSLLLLIVTATVGSCLSVCYFCCVQCLKCKRRRVKQE